jgi:hypothetical protein
MFSGLADRRQRTSVIQDAAPGVDCLGMPGSVDFEDLLDEALSAAQDDTPKIEDRYVYLPASAAPFVFVYSRTASAVTPREALDAASAARASRAYGRPAPSPRVGSSRPLSPMQQRALDEMLALGARLHGDFTASELRRAFKMLAREYHPDRHPHTTAEEQERLAALFADLAEYYRCLLTLFAREAS